MAEGCERNFKNMTNWGHVINTTEAKVGQESRAFHTKEQWIVQNGPRQQIVTIIET